MTDSETARLPDGLSGELTKSLASLWTRYAGTPPSETRTVIDGNVITCVLADAVRGYNRGMLAAEARDAAEGALDPHAAANATYRREAIAIVCGLTRQRVAHFASSHDRDTDVATEVFTLEPSLSRGARPARAERR